MHVVATAGHVDHGKSTLVLALTGIDPDRLVEEKSRGLTIDLGFAWTALASGRELAFVDVPGHVRFIRNMLAGVGAVDACVFVVAATEGWKPQSEEHLRILSLLGIRHGLIALTKVGLVDDEWQELARMEIEDHVAGTFLEGAEVVAVDAPSGFGIDHLRSSLDKLLGAVPTAVDRDRPRLWVDRSFAAKGSGTVVTGTLVGGAFHVDEELVVMDGHKAVRVRVRALQSHQRPFEAVGPGHRLAVNLSGISHDQVTRGHALIRPGQWAPTRTLDASLQILASLDHEVSRRGAHQLYIGSGEYPVRMRVLGTDALPPGAEGLVRLHLPLRLPLLPGDRFVLRESGRSETVGGGEVLDVAPVLPASKARPSRSVERVIEERGWVDAAELTRLTGASRAANVGDRWVVAPGALAATMASVVDACRDGGEHGLDVASLNDRQRAVLPLLSAEITLDAGRAWPAGTAARAAALEGLSSHPWLLALRAAQWTPPDPEAAGADRQAVRELVRLAESPEGFTVATIRDRLGTTRKYVLPLLSHLDATGITRRRGDIRIGGPRLPAL
jgi:selenocysteine-specific elongation factor